MSNKPPDSLRAARAALKKTQGDIAIELEVTQAAVSHWERGATPHPELWADIARVYKLSEAVLTKHYVAVMKAKKAS